MGQLMSRKDAAASTRLPWLVAAAVIAQSGCDSSAAPGPAATGAPATTATTAAPAPAPPDKTCSPACSSIERCDPQKGTCVPACPEGEVFIPATGPKGFALGTGLRGKVDKPHQVVLTQPFCMDATEVTVKAYKACVTAGKCEEPRLWGMWINYNGPPHHPINKVSWPQAKTYCEVRGQSLPTEAQWVWAATGGDGRHWPWGNDEPSCDHADFTPAVLEGPASNDGCKGGGTSPVGAHPKGDKTWPDGKLHDMAGNVWEWTLDNYVPFTGKDETDPLHLDEPDGVHVVRGGGWNRSGRGIRADYRGGAVVGYQVPGLGFRCVRNPKGTGRSAALPALAASSPPAAASAPAAPGSVAPKDAPKGEQGRSPTQ